MTQHIYFLTNDEAQDILRDRLAAIERCLMSVYGEEDIKVIHEKIDMMQKRIWDCKNLAEEIQKKKEQENVAE